jgi:tetratricopeptide (TPR) repeat protein
LAKNKKGKRKSAHNLLKRDNKVVYILLLVIVPLLLYIRVVNFGMSGLDDSTIILNINNGEVNLSDAFTHDAFMSDKGNTFYRPMQVISLIIDSRLGGNELWIYHLSNLILHILTVIVLFSFLKMAGIKKEISFLLSLMFSINPMFTNAVAWIPARGDILLSLFSLLSIITFLEYFKSRKAIYIFLHTIVFTLAMFSKETAVLLPFLYLSYIYFVQRKRFQVMEVIPFITIWLISFVLFFSLRQSIIKVEPTSNIFGIIPFIKNLPTIPITFGKFFIPNKLTTMPLFDNTAITIGVTLLILFTAATIKILKGRKREIIWGAIWFLLFTVPPMFYRSYFASIGYEYFEYRAYFPIIGVLYVAGFFIDELTLDITFKKVLIISIPVLLIYLVIAFIHSSVFADPISFFTSAIKANSNNAMALEERGVTLFNNGMGDKAIADFDNSIGVCRTYSPSYFNKGVLLGSLNDHYKAEYFFSLALKYDTLDQDASLLKENAYINLSHEKLFFHKYNEAITLLKKGTDRYPNNCFLNNYLGEAYFSINKFDSALYEFNKAWESKKNSFKFYNNRGMAKYQLNDFAGALQDFNKALELKPDFPGTWINKGAAKIRLNNYEGAISDINMALRLDSMSGEAYYYRGKAYSQLNKRTEAAEDRKKAQKFGFKELIGEKEKSK